MKITHFNSGISMRTRLLRWHRKALALVINLKRFQLALRYLVLRKQNYNVVHARTL